MAKSAPQISFSVSSIDYGTIDVGGSSAWKAYYVYGHSGKTADSSYARAINMSISFKESYNASEARKESWVMVSTPLDATEGIGSVGGNEVYVGSIIAGQPSSYQIRTYTSIPAGAAAAGHVGFYLHHRICAVIRRICGYINIRVRIFREACRWSNTSYYSMISPFGVS